MTKNTPKRILIVEDEAIVAVDIKATLEKLGYKVVDILSTGEEAVAIAGPEKVDLVLMDIKLKGYVSGIEAAKQIKKLNIPVIFSTAYGDKKTVERAKKAEPNGFLCKPFNEQELRSTIEVALSMHNSENKLRESEERFRTYMNILFKEQTHLHIKEDQLIELISSPVSITGRFFDSFGELNLSMGFSS